MEQFRYCIEGLVQGVGFRQFIQQKAKNLGLKGYVRNLAEGSVECVAQGAKEQLESFLHSLQKGPSFSRVDSISKEKIKTETFGNFLIRYE